MFSHSITTALTDLWEVNLPNNFHSLTLIVNLNVLLPVGSSSALSKLVWDKREAS